MLPSGKSKSTAFKTLIYALFLIPLSILPTFSFTGQLELSLTVVCYQLFWVYGFLQNRNSF